MENNQMPTPTGTPQYNSTNIPPQNMAMPVGQPPMQQAPMPAPAPKKSHAGIIIVIVLVLLVIVGAVVCVLLLNGNKEDKKEDTNAKIQDEKKEEEEQPTGGLDEQAKARNAVREIDLERIIRAASDYMTNNNGKTPFGTKYDKKTMGLFVTRYIDSDIDSEGVEESKPFKCKSDRACMQFADVSGKNYAWTVDVAASGKKDEAIKYTADNGLDYTLHVYVKAICGDTRGTYTTGSGERQFAIFYIEEGGIVACVDSASNKLKVYGDEEPIPQDGSAKSVAKRNMLRANGLSSMLTAVNDYQANNNGKTPFGTSSAIATDYTKFVVRYVDSGVAEAKFGQSSCASGKKCVDFTDPDGTIISLKAYKQADINSVLSKVISNGVVDHTIYVAVKAACSSDSKSSVAGSGDRQIAMFYMGENKTMYCNDNH